MARNPSKATVLGLALSGLRDKCLASHSSYFVSELPSHVCSVRLATLSTLPRRCCWQCSCHLHGVHTSTSTAKAINHLTPKFGTSIHLADGSISSRLSGPRVTPGNRIIESRPICIPSSASSVEDSKQTILMLTSLRIQSRKGTRPD